MTSQLPERPDLEQLKRQAKELLNAARNQNAGELARFRLLPAYAGRPEADLSAAGLSLHDAQSVIAREHGFASWNAMRERVEELTLEFGAAVNEFIEAATSGRHDRAERLLALHPRIARANFHTALLLADVALVESQLAGNPSLATGNGGPRDWPALLYLCHSSLRPKSEAHEANVARLAARLMALGADPNARYPWLHHGVRRPALWAACSVATNLKLARALLEAGANPNDGVTLTLAVGSGDIPVLELLVSHGADVNFPWATDGAAPLYAVLAWAHTLKGIRWILEHGANADPVFAKNGETPLHAAATRWSVDLVELLVSRGSDLARRRLDGRTPYAIAELNGNQAVADWLVAHGAVPELSPVDRFVATCRRGDRSGAQAMLAERPGLRDEIAPEHYTALHQAAEKGDVAALAAMLACGFDPNRDDGQGRTALHAAAHEGQAAAVAVLLQHGASVTVIDAEFHASPLIWAADGARTHPDRDYDPVARLLIAAGSPLQWQEGEEPSGDLLDIIDRWRRM